MTFMPLSELRQLSDQDIGIYASGGYGAKKRIEFLAGLRVAFKQAAKADARTERPAGWKGQFNEASQ
jgi:hypothetical protein